MCVCVYTDDGRLPKQLFYGEMWERKKSALKLKKRFKDNKILSETILTTCGPMASDRGKWRKLIHESIESFEDSRKQYSANKRLIRKGEQGPALCPQSHRTNCDIFEKLCLSLAGLKSHLRKCTKSILHPKHFTANKTERLCQFCGKICRSSAGLNSHLRTHRI